MSDITEKDLKQALWAKYDYKLVPGTFRSLNWHMTWVACVTTTHLKERGEKELTFPILGTGGIHGMQWVEIPDTEILAKWCLEQTENGNKKRREATT